MKDDAHINVVFIKPWGHQRSATGVDEEATDATVAAVSRPLGRKM